MANFAPANHADPSLRGDMTSIQLFHLIYKIPSSDVHVQRDNIYDFSQEVITSSGHYTKLDAQAGMYEESSSLTGYW